MRSQPQFRSRLPGSKVYACSASLAAITKRYRSRNTPQKCMQDSPELRAGSCLLDSHFHLAMLAASPVSRRPAANASHASVQPALRYQNRPTASRCGVSWLHGRCLLRRGSDEREGRRRIATSAGRLIAEVPGSVTDGDGVGGSRDLAREAAPGHVRRAERAHQGVVADGSLLGRTLEPEATVGHVEPGVRRCITSAAVQNWTRWFDRMGARGAGHSPKIVSVLSAQRPDESSTKVLPLAGRVVVPTYTVP